MNEADTCRIYIPPKLKTSDWEDDYFTEQMVLTPGRIAAYLHSFPLSDDLPQAPLASLRRLQSATGEELHLRRTLLSSVLRLQGGAFKGEL